MYDYAQMGYWTILPYHTIHTHPALRLSPSGVVPQSDRRPHPIMDYSFCGLNAESLPLSPAHAMQFGHTLRCIIQRLVYCNPTFGPPLLAKIDLADGYYRVPLSSTAALHLAVLLPSDVPGPPLVTLPLTLPMGWAHSPPFFCAFTETMADIANTPGPQPPHHPLLATAQLQQTEEDLLDFHPAAVTLTTAAPLAFHNVYLDDFITIAQRPTHLQTLNKLLHSIDMVLSDPPDSNRRAIISRSKLDKGDATLSTSKKILGWNIDTVCMTVTLPNSRLEMITQLLQRLLAQRTTSGKQWRKLLGTLWSSLPALYGATHLFSILQTILQEATGKRVHLTSLVKHVLHEWIHLITTANTHPVPLHTLVPRAPDIVAASDTSKQGMGGFAILPHHDLPSEYSYIAWRAPFPEYIQSAMVSAINPTGSITNSDLELAAITTGATVAARAAGHKHANIILASDNTPAVAWMSSGSTTTQKPPAFLLHQLARFRHAIPFDVSTIYTPGSTNTLADCCSRSFHLTDDQWEQHLNSFYPVKTSWTIVPPTNATLSAMNSALSMKPLPKASPPKITRK
jgi:hypothetical protein